MAETTSYAFQAYGGSIEPVTSPRPEPGPGEVRVAVEMCGVCHTDVHVHQGYYDIGDGERMLYRDRGIVPPIVMGHEIIGTVDAVGPGVDQALVGQRRLVYPWIGCGGCRACERGEEQLCAAPRYLGIFRPGGYARHVTVPHQRYLVDVEGIAPEQAATLACSGLTAYGAIRRAGEIGEGEWIAVLGCGGVGQTALALLRTLGHERVVAIDPDAAKRRAIAESGVATLDARAGDVAAQLADVTSGRLMAALDFVGNEQTSALALGALAKGGRYVVVGLFGGKLRFPLPFIPVRVLSILGSYVGSLQELRDLVALVKAQGVPRIPVEKQPLEQAEDAIDRLAKGEVAGRIILTA